MTFAVSTFGKQVSASSLNWFVIQRSIWMNAHSNQMAKYRLSEPVFKKCTCPVYVSSYVDLFHSYIKSDKSSSININLSEPDVLYL